MNQISSLKKILRYLIKKYRINVENILGHSDIAPDRKKDPGEKFPWKNLSRIKLAKWHKIKEKNLKKLRLIRLSSKEENELLKNLFKIGYYNQKSLALNSKKKMLFKTFQRRFRQSLVNGIGDKECLLISKNLLKS